MPSREIAVHMQISPSEYIVGLRGVKIEVDGTGTGALIFNRWDDDLSRFIRCFSHNDAPHLHKMRASVGTGYVFAAMQILSCVAKGLEVIHKDGWMHGDISSANVLWRQTPYAFQAALTDFGKCVRQNSNEAHDVGIFYRPPISKMEPKRTRALDIYSFGILIYSLVMCKMSLPATGALRKLELESASQVFKASVEPFPNCKQALLDVAWDCVNTSPTARPAATELVAAMEKMMT